MSVMLARNNKTRCAVANTHRSRVWRFLNISQTRSMIGFIVAVLSGGTNEQPREG